MLCHPRKDTMTNIDSYAPRFLPLPRAHSLTIYLNSPSTRRSGGLDPQPNRSSVRALVSKSEHTGNGLLVGLAALTVPAVVYSLAQLCSLVSGGSLEHAVRAFLS